ncbi:MFS transporter [Streptomyces noursei]|uniref:MFS transporter n=1 Tax=Streptomyces noursei TaxID=1971 RepID=UPI0023B79FED|nr:MFS transporter [Streptomyces noursei]
MGIVIPLAPVLGPILGGVIVQGLDWRWMFLINVPIGLAAILLSLRVVPAGPPTRTRATSPRLDVIGLALLGPAFAVLVFALSQATGNAGFGAPPVRTALILGTLLLIAYLAHAARAGTRALIRLSLFRSRSFLASVTVMGLTGVMLFSLLFLVPLYQQRVRGHEVLAAGMLLTPLGIGSFLAMPVAGRTSDLIGARRLAPLGGLLVALSAFTYTQADARTDEVLLGLVAFATGVGLGLIGAPTMGALYRTLPQDAVPQGTAALYIINQLGASLGTAVVALVLQGQTNAGRTQVAAFQHASRWVLAAALAVLLTGFFLPGKKATVATAEGSPAAPNGTNYAEEPSN